jgi:acyl-homoserine-lactone acylase
MSLRAPAPARLFAIALAATLFIAGAGAAAPAGAQEGVRATHPPQAASAAAPSVAGTLARQVEIRRTEYGVPHILAENLKAAAYALAWVQVEDHGATIPLGLARARGELARQLGFDSLERDFAARPVWLRAAATYHLLEQDTRDVYDGFAAGVNRFIELHPERFPEWLKPDFTGHDVAAREIGTPSVASARRVVERTLRRGDRAERMVEGVAALRGADADVGSNAWALAPSRTRSGRAILMRNPHLAWSAGYYEAHVRVPGVLDFYGDFRIGGPFSVVGGFNPHLGWATTNNEANPDVVYALVADPDRRDHYRFDGASLPLTPRTLTLEYRNGDALATETRTWWDTPLGTVVHREDGRIYVVRSGGDGEFRSGEQFLRMMRAGSLAEWRAAMGLLARRTSNFTYADRAGNILYVWAGTVPRLPHASGGDTLALEVHGSGDVWMRLVAFDSLPQLLNPRGGYVRNENDPFHFTNLNQVLDFSHLAADLPEPRLRLRSQHSLALLHGTGRLSLEDVVERKHSMRMLLADRVKPDLLRAAEAAVAAGAAGAGGAGALADAVAVLRDWDNTAAAESRGGVLFEAWWRHYNRAVAAALAEAAAGGGIPGSGAGRVAPRTPTGAELFALPWTPAEPVTTPRGLARADLVPTALEQAAEEVRRRYGALDVAWGDVHRVRHGAVDAPVGGCAGALGCFRVLQFREAEDGKRVVTGGDGWVLAVEFGDPPRAYSVLAYGQSPDPASPHHDDQAALFAANRMKPVAWTEREIERRTVRRYRPGL